MKISSFYSLSKILLSVTCSLMISCQGNKTNETVATVEETDGSTNKQDAEQTVPGNSLLYLDCSDSMKGYVSTPTDATFNSVVSTLLFWKQPTKAILFDVKEKEEISRDELIRRLSTRNIAWSDESDLAKMIETMVGQVNSNAVGIAYLMTDGIMSGSNKDINGSVERSYNYQNRGALKGKIADATKKCNDQTAILVVKYSSAFTGVYYCYTNKKEPLKNKIRPFYVVAIGHRKAVKELVEKVYEDEILSRNEGFVLLGDELPYDLSFVVSRKSGVKYSSKGYIDISGIHANDTVSINGYLKELPQYMKNMDYFQRNGDVYIQYGSNGEYKKLDKNIYAYQFKEDNLRINIQAKYLRGNSLYFQLNYELPGWIKMSSTDNDLDIQKSVIPQTFIFEDFIKGLAEINSTGSIIRNDTIKFN